MRSERKRKVMTLSILLIAIFAISIGFAAFSTTLKIGSGMIVTPDETEFKVMFSSSENKLETNTIKANPESMGDDATIDNTTMPTISGLSVNFVNPGDSVSYTFYVRNEGEYEAFLNSISFRGKECIPGEGANLSMVLKACDSIKTTVSVGNITTNETLINITGESLIPKQTKQVTVTISYDSNGSRVNGPFTVEFGDISMYYDAVSGTNEEVEAICQLTYDENANKQVDMGDEVTCGTETFYRIISDLDAHPSARNDDNITLLAKYNLDVGNIYDRTSDGKSINTPITSPTGIQNSSAIGVKESGYPYYGVIAFSKTNYWGSVSKGTFVYNSNSLLYPYVENYKTYMKNIVGVDVKEASLASLTQYNSFKSYANFNVTSFWLGTFAETFSNDYVTLHNIYASNSSYGNTGTYDYSTDTEYGVRPIIVISKSNIGVS